MGQRRASTDKISAVATTVVAPVKDDLPELCPYGFSQKAPKDIGLDTTCHVQNKPTGKGATKMALPYETYTCFDDSLSEDFDEVGSSWGMMSISDCMNSSERSNDSSSFSFQRRRLPSRKLPTILSCRHLSCSSSSSEEEEEEETTESTTQFDMSLSLQEDFNSSWGALDLSIVGVSTR